MLEDFEWSMQDPRMGGGYGDRKTEETEGGFCGGSGNSAVCVLVVVVSRLVLYCTYHASTMLKRRKERASKASTLFLLESNLQLTLFTDTYSLSYIDVGEKAGW